MAGTKTHSRVQNTRTILSRQPTVSLLYILATAFANPESSRVKAHTSATPSWKVYKTVQTQRTKEHNMNGRVNLTLGTDQVSFHTPFCAFFYLIYVSSLSAAQKSFIHPLAIINAKTFLSPIALYIERFCAEVINWRHNLNFCCYPQYWVATLVYPVCEIVRNMVAALLRWSEHLLERAQSCYCTCMLILKKWTKWLISVYISVAVSLSPSIGGAPTALRGCGCHSREGC